MIGKDKKLPFQQNLKAREPIRADAVIVACLGTRPLTAVREKKTETKGQRIGFPKLVNPKYEGNTSKRKNC